MKKNSIIKEFHKYVLDFLYTEVHQTRRKKLLPNIIDVFTFPFFFWSTNSTDVLKHENPRKKKREEDRVLIISHSVCMTNLIIEISVNDSFEIFYHFHTVDTDNKK
jgi:hypothetical protein